MKEYDINTESDNLIKTSSDDDIDFKSRTSSDIEEIDPDKVQIVLKDIKAEYTSVSQILSPPEVILEERDLFEVVKFTIKLEAVHEYKWEVYRKPSEIKRNFENISQELDKKSIVLTGNFGEMFDTVQSWTDDGIQIHISELENFYRNLFMNPQVYNTQAFQEFFNISIGSFNQFNEGSKPFEGYVYKSRSTMFKKGFQHCLLLY